MRQHIKYPKGKKLKTKDQDNVLQSVIIKYIYFNVFIDKSEYPLCCVFFLRSLGKLRNF